MGEMVERVVAAMWEEWRKSDLCPVHEKALSWEMLVAAATKDAPTLRKMVETGRAQARAAIAAMAPLPHAVAEAASRAIGTNDEGCTAVHWSTLQEHFDAVIDAALQ